MINIIGLVTLAAFLIVLLVIQYLLMTTALVKNNLNTIESYIGWVPFLPYILMLILGTYLICVAFVITPFKRWVELKWGWLFVKNKNRDVWARYLRSKYND